MNRLLPRLDTSAALRELTRLRGDTAEGASAAQLAEVATAASHPAQHWYPLGPRVGESDLQALRDELDTLAHRHGFPDSLPATRDTERSQSLWDRQLGRLLVDHLRSLGAAELDHPDVWTWLGVVLAPHLIRWRWGWPRTPTEGQEQPSRRKYERYLGTLRSGLRRPWYRTVMYASDGGLYPDLTEDHLVSIEERPGLGADQRVGVALLQGIDDAYTRTGFGNLTAEEREERVRMAARLLLAESVVMPVSARHPDGLREQFQVSVWER